MTTRDAAAEKIAAPETCPVCASADVRAIELAWFAIELERAAEVREADVEFACRDCGSRWR
ncbi:hypothetical protein GH740_05125 [Microbacterium sp. SYP-A9085]|jgi:predicted RNA-binding Zn-ribbon protein involved in translation (DUF1610 family)|uniref:hypothetical protein n=1 Tax=Microbacterium sp. SYP-A9085 TaxID=2664454 RepID=UPI00129BFAB1|nr:hypothetical protein [Microbacterium sp. SYP-A9085]MRH28695.1 hypothetical protein [Microbacterium sp. SYP-A9085]